MMKVKLIILINILTTLTINAQEQLSKIKSKNLIGVWNSNDSISKSTTHPILTFYKATEDVTTTNVIATILKIKKDESINIIKKNDFIPNIDTISAKWFFVENSKNLKIIEKIKATNNAVTYKDASGNQSNFDFL